MTAVDQPADAKPPVFHPDIPRRPGTMRVVSAKINVRHRVLDIWTYRELFVGMTRKELKVKYKNSAPGFFWSMLNPAVSLLVYYVVFQLILKNGIPYFAIYLISGVLVWNLFSTALSGGCGSAVADSSIIKKVAFPREIPALASVGAALIHFFLQCIVVVLFLAAFSRGPAVEYLPLLVPALLALLLLTGALGVLFAAINVRLRDVQHLALTVWFWGTPIIYQYRLVRDKTIASGGLRWPFILWLANPVTPIVLSVQRAIYGVTSPKSKSGVPVHILPDHAGLWC